MIGAIIGKAADSVGQVLNTSVAAVMDPDTKKGFSYDELVAPVPEEMQAKFPGLEMLMLPEQKHLVFHQKVEAAELMSTMAQIGLNVADVPISVPDVETPNTYAVRGRDNGITYYLVQELSNGWEGYCCRDQCRRNMPMKFIVKNLRTKEVVARIESPCACDPCCCGCWWFLCLIPIPVCCCSRTATWKELKVPIPEGTECTPEALEAAYVTSESSRDIATASLGCTTSDCGCSMKIDAATADGSTNFSLFKRMCCCTSNGCMSDAELTSEWNIIDESHSWESPLGRIWKAMWKTDYQPTNDTYPPLPDPTVGSIFKDLFKHLGKDLFTDADTRLLECPHESANAKAALVTAALVADYFYSERSS